PRVRTGSGGMRVVKPEWGTKRTCPHCGARFYDLRHSPIICPKCSHVVEAEAPVRPRRPSAAAAAVAVEPKPLPVAAEEGVPEGDNEAEEIEALEDEDGEGESIESEEEEDAELIEDASDLGEDDDDMAEVMEHLDEDLEDEV